MKLELEIIQTLVLKGEKLAELILFEEQLEIYNKILEAKAGELFDLVVATLARKTGKTFTAVVIAVDVALGKDNAVLLYAAPTREMLGKFIIPVFNEVIQFLPKEMRPTKSGNEYIFPNESVIRLEGCDFQGGDALRGPAADFIVMDEAGFVKADLNYILQSIFRPMIQHTNGIILVCSTPPRTIAHFYYQLAMEAMAEGRHILKTIYDCTKYKHEPKKIEKIIKNSKGRQSVYFRREYMCEFITDQSARIVPEFSEEAHNGFEMEYGPDRPNYFQPYECIDFGFKHNTGIVFGYLDFLKRKFIVEGEITIKSKTTGEIVRLIQAKEKELWGDYLKDNPHVKVKRFGDNNLQLCADMTRDHGMTVIPIKKIGLEATVNSLRNIINTNFIIKAQCKNTRWQLLNGVWDDKRKNFEEGPSSPKDYELDEFMEDDMIGHCDNLAALMYLNRHINWRDNPAPNQVIDPQTQFQKGGSLIIKNPNKVEERAIFKVRKF